MNALNEQNLDAKVVDSMARAKVYAYIAFEQDDSLHVYFDYPSLGKKSLSEQIDCLAAIGQGMQKLLEDLSLKTAMIANELL